MNLSNLNVCMLPLMISWGDRKSNFEKLEEALMHMHPDTDILILPETFATGFPTGMVKDEVLCWSESVHQNESVKRLQKLSSRYNVAIIGTIIVNEQEKLYNRLFFVEPSGEYFCADKAHLFRMGGENELFTEGNKRLKVRFRGWNISAVVCYDIRFPIWCRNRNNEYDLLIVVANWPSVRNDVWRSLLKARAIENLSYICGVNCKGEDREGIIYDGASMAVDFKGKNITVSTANGNLLYAVLDKEKLEHFRNKFPVWKDADDFSLERESR